MHGCRHGIAMVNGTVSLRLGLVAAGLEAEERSDHSAVHVFLHGLGGDRGQHGARVRRRRPRHVQSRSGRRWRRPSRRGPGRSFRCTSPGSRPTWTRSWPSPGAEAAGDRGRGTRARRELQRTGPQAAWATWRRSRSSRARTSRAAKGGVITTNDDALAAVCRSLHNCGRVPTGVWYEHHVISGNYRLGRIAGRRAQLAARSPRGADQHPRRQRPVPGRAAGPLPGVHPQERPSFCTRHSLPLVHAADRRGGVRGAPRRRDRGAACRRHSVLGRATGSRCRISRCSRIAPSARIWPDVNARLDYNRVHCPNSDLLCREQAVWLEQSIFLGPREDAEDVARGFEKAYESREKLAEWGRGT